MIDLKGRTALVTGGTMGVGHAMARSLAQAGADVVVIQLPALAEQGEVALVVLKMKIMLLNKF